MWAGTSSGEDPDRVLQETVGDEGAIRRSSLPFWDFVSDRGGR